MSETRLRVVKNLLKKSGIPEKRIEEAYQLIKSSGRYPARIPNHYVAIAVELLERDRKNPKGVHVYISPKPTTYALGRPSVTFAVLALDWPGLIDSCTGTIHEKGFNIAFCEALVIAEEKRNVALIFMEIDVTDEGTFEDLLRMEPEIRDALLVRAAEETGKRELLITETKKSEQYSLVRRELLAIADPADSEALFGEKGEAIRFFLARTFAYLEERQPKDLADQIYTNYIFQKKVRETGNIYAKVTNIRTKTQELTALSAAGYEKDITMGDVFRVIEETVPGYQRKYDKAFITGDGINVLRIEFVDAKGNPLSHDQMIELERRIVAMKETPACDRLSPGVELIARKIVPIMLEEARALNVPQVYMHPHSRSNIKVVLVTTQHERGYGFKILEEINKVTGLQACMPDPPTIVASSATEQAPVQELSIIDVWVDFEKFFGTPKGPYQDEKILTAIEEAIRQSQPFGAKIRIFDRTGRQLKQDRVERICSQLEQKGMDTEVGRQILLRLGDKQMISPTVEDSEIIRNVSAGIEAVLNLRKTGRPAIVIKKIEKAGSHEKGYTVAALAYSSKENLMSKLIEKTIDYGLLSSSIVSGEDYTLLLIRLQEGMQPLDDEKMQKLESDLAAITMAD